MSDEDLTAETPEDTELVRRLRQELKDRSTALAQEREGRQSLEKKTVFTDLGIDTSKGAGRLFFENYDGDISAEAIKQTADEYGLEFTSEPPPTPTQPKSDEEQQQRQQEAAANKAIDDASSGASPAGGAPDDPDQQAWEAYDETMSTTGSNENAMAAYFSTKLQNAVKAAKGE